MNSYLSNSSGIRGRELRSSSHHHLIIFDGPIRHGSWLTYPLPGNHLTKPASSHEAIGDLGTLHVGVGMVECALDCWDAGNQSGLKIPTCYLSHRPSQLFKVSWERGKDSTVHLIEMQHTYPYPGSDQLGSPNRKSCSTHLTRC